MLIDDNATSGIQSPIAVNLAAIEGKDFQSAILDFALSLWNPTSLYSIIGTQYTQY